MSIHKRLFASVELFQNAWGIKACVNYAPAKASPLNNVGVLGAIYGSEYHAPSLTQE